MPDVSTQDVSLRVLGPVECSADVAALGGPKQRLLLALLVARAGHVVAAEAIVDAIWGDAAPGDARHTLQVFVSRLRTALGPAGGTVHWRSSGYVLALPDGALDAHRFEHLLARAPDEAEHHVRRHLLVEALSLWRGRPFGELGDHPALVPEVERLTELRLHAAEVLADLDLADGRHDAAVGLLRQLAAEHPLSESLGARLMLALHRARRRGEALTVFEQMRQTLSEELGVDPSRLLQRLHLLLLDDDPRVDVLGVAELDEVAALPDVTGAGARVREPRPGSVAVLPLEVIGQIGDLEVLASGLHTDLITELSRRDGMTVVGRTSVLGLPDGTPVPAIAAQLGVGALVEGSLQGSGTRFRLTVRLVDGGTGAQRWTVTYDDDLTAQSLFSVQRDLAREIATRLSAQLDPGPARAEPARTTSLDAYRLVAAARVDYDTKTGPSLAAAVEGYRRATETDPRYVDAWVGLGKAWAATELYGHGDRHVSLPLAEVAVHRALALEPDSPEALTALGYLHTAHQDGTQALAALERAAELRPGYADAHAWLCWLRLITGQREAALRSALRTVELDPRAAEAQAHLALAHAATGAAADGLEAVREARRLSSYPTAVLYEGTCLVEAGRLDEAAAALEPLTDGGHEDELAWTEGGAQMALVIALTKTGRRGAARRVAEQIDPGEHPFARGLAHLALDETTAAADRLARVESLGQWPTIVLHHFFLDLWRGTGPVVRQRLLEVGRRTWRIPGP